MAITDTTRKAENGSSSTSALQLTLNSTAAGSLIAVAASLWQASSFSCSDNVNGSYGSPVFSRTSSGNTTVALWVFPNNAGGNLTITINRSPSDWIWGAVHEFAGVALSSPQSGVASTAIGSSTPCTTGTITPPDNDVLLLAALSLNDAGAITHNAGGEGFTLSNEDEDTGSLTGQPGSFVFKIVSGAPGTVSHSWSLSGSFRDNAAGIAAFKPLADPALDQSGYQFFNDDGNGLGEAA